ncbi:hypothetical protein [Pseudomonas sp. EA_105y_Pfl2_R69]|uniref:hypothetical protein n=1 Tax=Pseudomonas sp. EA_105y_Pfl2_R69 TaxID=3088683 RepID=UPI0030DC71C3
MIAEFATIVGLLSAFSSGRKTAEQTAISDFLSWLSEHNHEEIRASIENNQVTTVSIKALLNKGLDDVHQKLDDISTRIAILASRSDGVEELALAYAKESISEQSLEILALMEEYQTEFFLLLSGFSGPEQALILSPGPNYTCKETRFLKDDLALMVGLGLLVLDYNSNGNPMYFYTRAASKLVRSMS